MDSTAVEDAFQAQVEEDETVQCGVEESFRY